MSLSQRIALAWRRSLCTLLLGAACMLPAFAQSPAPERVTVRGVVVNAATGDPLPRALVRLEGDVALGALTDGDGHFEIPGVETGLQTFDIEKPGFRSRVDLPGANVPASRTVRVGAGLPELHFSLAPLNTLTGRIALSTGDPGVGIGITLLRQTVSEGHATWTVQDTHQSTPDGSFRFGSLPDGVYLLRTAPATDNEQIRTPACESAAPVSAQGLPVVFFGGGADLAGAARIPLADGQNFNAEIGLAPVTFYRVQVVPEHVPAGAGWEYSVAVLNANGGAVEYPVREDAQTHGLCAFLPDGSYLAALSATMEEDGAGRRGRTGQPLGALAPVTIQGSPAAFRVPLVAAAGPTVHVRYEPGPPPAANGSPTAAGSTPVTLELSPASTGDVSVSAEDDGTGSLAFPLLSPGAYWLNAAPGQPGTCVGAAMAGNQPLGSAPLVVGATGSASDIELVLRTDCATLTLQLADSPGDILPGEAASAYVAVVPEFDFAGTTFEAPMDATGDNRTATIANLPPGAYRIVVSRDPRALEWRNPAVRAALGGQEITLEPGGHATFTVEAPQP